MDTKLPFHTKLLKVSTRRLVTPLILFSTLGISQVSHSQNTTFSEDDLALLAIKYERSELGYGIEAYVTDNNIYVALVDMIALFELDIKVDVSGAKGNMYGTQNSKTRFSLAPSGNTWMANVGSKSYQTSPKDIVIYDDIIYVNSELMNLWFGAELSLNFSESYLRLETSKPLPFEKRLARLNQKPGQARRTRETPKNPWIKKKYALAEIPSLDLNARYRATRNHKTDNKLESKAGYSILGQGDLGLMSARTFVSGSDTGDLSAVNFRMERRDHTNSLLGPLEVSHLSLGDLNTLGTSGRGFYISNSDIVSSTQSQDAKINGEYHPGWEVELTQGGVVLDRMTIGDNGRYSFENVSFFKGDNTFLLKFYGPGGKEEQEEKSYYIGSSEEDLRKLKYSFSMYQPQKSLFNINDSNDVTEDIDEISFNSSLNLTNRLSLNASVKHQLYSDKENVTLGGFGIDTYFGSHSFGVSAGRNTEGNINTSINISGYSTNFRYDLGITDFSDDDILNKQDYGVHGRASLRNGNFQFIGDFKHVEFTDGRNQQELDVGFSNYLNAVNISNYFEYERVQPASGDETEEMRGNLSLHYSLHPLSIRFVTDYDILPDFEGRYVALNTAFSVNRDVGATTTVRHNLSSKETEYSIGLRWDTPYVKIIPTYTYSDNGKSQGLITFLANFDKRTNSHSNFSHYNISGINRASRGTFKARLFEDLNGDGQYGFGEPLLEGGSLYAKQFNRSEVTDEKGEVLFDNLKAWQPTDIAYEQGSVFDGPMVYTGKPFSVAARPGSVIGVNMPMNRAADLEGYIYRKTTSGTNQAKGVVVLLVNNIGEIVDRKVTDSSGYYIFEFVPPGDYELKVQGEKLTNPISAKITVSRQGKADKIASLYLPPLKLINDSLFSETTAIETAEEITEESLLVEPIVAAIPIPETPITAQPEITPLVSLEPFWALQVASYKQVQLAQDLVNRLQKAGYSAFTKEAVIGGNTYTRVYAGQAKTASNLQNDRQAINQLLRVQSFPVKIES
ncbi:MAG: SPOR domain-containing protein [Cellvibrionaceae bacterium]